MNSEISTDFIPSDPPPSPPSPPATTSSEKRLPSPKPSENVSKLPGPLSTSPKSSSNWLPAAVAEVPGATNSQDEKMEVLLAQSPQPLGSADKRHVKYAAARRGDSSAIILNEPRDMQESSKLSQAHSFSHPSTVTAAASLAFAHKSPIETERPIQTAGKAASKASREHHPVEIWQPPVSSSAGKAAVTASKEHKLTKPWSFSSDSFASRAATRAHKTSITEPLKEEPPIVSETSGRTNLGSRISNQPPVNQSQLEHKPVFGSTDRKDGTAKDISRSRRQSDIVRAATVSMASFRKAPHEGRVLRKRPGQGNLEEVAKQVAARRLERLEAEHSKSSGIMRRFSLPTISSSSRAKASSAEFGRSTSSQITKTDTQDYHRLMERARQNASETIGSIEKGMAEKNAFRRTLEAEAARVAQKKSEEIEQREKAKLESAGVPPLEEWLPRVSEAARKESEGMMENIEREPYDASRIPPGEEWISRTAKSAQKLAEQETAEKLNVEKVDIGGGRFMDRREIEDIASRHVKPLLEEIDQKAERERARREEERAQKLEKERLEQLEKQRAKELKEQKRRSKALEKEEAQKQKEAEREEKRRQKAVHRRSFIFPILPQGEYQQPQSPTQRPETPTRIAGDERPLSPPTSPSSESKSGLRGWFSRMRERSHQRRLSTTQKPLPGTGPVGQAEMTPPSSPREARAETRPSGVGTTRDELDIGIRPEDTDQAERPLSPSPPTKQGAKYGISSLVNTITRKASLRRKNKGKGKEKEKHEKKGEEDEEEKVERSAPSTIIPVPTTVAIIAATTEAETTTEMEMVAPIVPLVESATSAVEERMPLAISEVLPRGSVLPVSPKSGEGFQPVSQFAAPAVTTSPTGHVSLSRDTTGEASTLPPTAHSGTSRSYAPIVLSSGSSAFGSGATGSPNQRLSGSYGSRSSRRASGGTNTLSGSISGRNFESKFRENL